MIYFTSDFHFGHEKEFLWKPRGFSTWEEHAEQVITNFNNIVTYADIVYVLGDCMLKNDDFGLQCLKRLNGHKYLAIGNHDSDARIERYKQENIFEDIQYGYRIRNGKCDIYAQHYPAMMGNYNDKHPVICLAGHTHSPDRFQNMANGCYNVALDAHGCYPVQLGTALTDIFIYRAAHPVPAYPDRSPYCSSCRNQYGCEARTRYDIMCPGYDPMNGGTF